MTPQLNSLACANPACAARLTPGSGALCRYCCDRLPAHYQTLLAFLEPTNATYPRTIRLVLDYLRETTQ